MNILYIARHNQRNSNDDEGAIEYSLTLLGHRVEKLEEASGSGRSITGFDFLLCHHWNDLISLKTYKIPRVFWCFDLIDYPKDPALKVRCEKRKQWITELTSLCDLGFCTDGEWVSRDTTGKLHWLPQGFDQRMISVYRPSSYVEGVSPPILFTGVSKKGGDRRAAFVQALIDRYGSRFTQVERGVHGGSLAQLISSHKIVVAPNEPLYEKYWSNRIYLTLGYGGFLLHPYIDELSVSQYRDGEHLKYYHSMEHLFSLIDVCLTTQQSFLNKIADQGRAETLKNHTYTNRCEKLIEIVRENL